jgi:uncharacterized protein YbjT (DUF2867 family)
MKTTVLVTGATGTIGSKVLKALASMPTADVHVRAAARSAAKSSLSSVPRAANVTPVDFDFDDVEKMKAALAGVERAFLLPPSVDDQVLVTSRFVDLAKAAGVKHIVKLSAFGCEVEPGIRLGRAHREVEKHVEASGMAWTFLRPNNFMENFINYYPPDAEGNIYLPWGAGACSFIAAEDVGAAAAHALTEDGHAGKAYTLTGPEALTVSKVAEILSAATGRAIQYVDVTEEAARTAMLGAKMPAERVTAMMELHAIDKAGYAAVVTSAVKEILGHPAKPFAAFAREHAARWS